MKQMFKAIALLLVGLVLNGCGGSSDERQVQSPQAATAGTIAVRQAVSSSYTTVVQQLYIAYFGRPADSGGLANFSAQLAGTGAAADIQSLNAAYGASASVRALVDGFGASEESRALYPGDTAAFVTAIYSNVLGRAPDQEGLRYWVSAIDARVLTKANASFSIMAGALVNQTPQGLADAALVNNRVAVATGFTDALTTPSLTDAYKGNAAAAIARAMLADVTAATDVSAFQSNISLTLAALTDAANRNRPPVAVAGMSRTVLVGTLVQLDGSGSYDLDQESISYRWSGIRPSGSTAVISDPASPSPTFLPDAVGNYSISLVVSDGRVESSVSTIDITAVSRTTPVDVSYFLFGGAGDAQYLGCLMNCGAYASESVCNASGSYGSAFSATSIWNQFGTYGSQFSNDSPWNSFTSSPPKVIDSDGRFHGYFSVNQFASPATPIAVLVDVLNYYKRTKNLAETRKFACL